MKKRDSTAPKKSRASKAPSTSSTTTTLKLRDQSTTTTRTPIAGDSDDDSMPPPPPPPTAKRKHSSTSSSSSVKKFKDDPDAESTNRPAKKRKLDPEIKAKRGSSTGSKGKRPVDGEVTHTVRNHSLPAQEDRPTMGAKRSHSRSKGHEDDADDEMKLPTPLVPPNVKSKGKSRARPDSDTDVEVISIKSSSSAASEHIQEMLDAIPADSDVDDVGDFKKERNEGAAGKKSHLKKGKSGSGKTTAKIEVLVYDKRGNFISGKQKPNTEVDVADPTSAKPNPKSRPVGKEKDSQFRKHSPRLSPGALQRLEVHDWDVLALEELQRQPIIPSKPETPPAAEIVPAMAKMPLFLDITPEPDYYHEEPEPREKHRTPSVLDRDEQGGGLEDGDLQDDESIVGELTYPDQMQVDHPEPEEEIIPAKPTATTSKPNSIRRGQTPEDLPGRVADIILRARTNNPRIRKEPTQPEIIPETETESNRNTDSQDSQPQPQPQDKAPLPSIVVPLTATRSERLISKMMPRSPHSRGGSRVSVIDEERFGTPFETPYENDDDAFNQDITVLSLVREVTPDRATGIHNNAKKPLRPLPVISPSAFAPHLPSSSLIESTTTDPTEEEDELMSSIEQFDSPDKGSYVAQRGHELAKAARLERIGDEKEKRKRITLEEIKAKVASVKGKEREVSVVPSRDGSGSRSRSRSHASATKDVQENEHVDDDPIQVDVHDTPDEETQPSADNSGPHKVPVCEEEEESTQDLLEELRAFEQQQRGVEEVDVHAGWDAPAPEQADDEHDEPPREDVQDEQDGDVQDEQDGDVQDEPSHEEEDLIVHDQDAEGELEETLPDVCAGFS